jgi:hypothetical protein
MDVGKPTYWETNLKHLLNSSNSKENDEKTTRIAVATEILSPTIKTQGVAKDIYLRSDVAKPVDATDRTMAITYRLAQPVVTYVLVQPTTRALHSSTTLRVAKATIGEKAGDFGHVAFLTTTPVKVDLAVHKLDFGGTTVIAYGGSTNDIAAFGSRVGSQIVGGTSLGYGVPQLS